MTKIEKQKDGYEKIDFTKILYHIHIDPDPLTNDFNSQFADKEYSINFSGEHVFHQENNYLDIYCFGNQTNVILINESGKNITVTTKDFFSIIDSYFKQRILAEAEGVRKL